VTVGADVVGYLFSAGGAVSVFLIIALWIGLSPSARGPRRWLIVAALLFSLSSIYGCQSLVTRALVGSYKPLQRSDVQPGRDTAIVVLGSGSVNAEDWDGRMLSVVDRTAASRVAEAVRVFQLVDATLVISSGGDPHSKHHGAPTGESMKDALVQAGVPADRIIVETVSKTTRDEAIVVAPMLAARGVSQVVLVTSGVHMARSLGAFRAVGVRAIPAIARGFTTDDSDYPSVLAFVPTKEGLAMASDNAHEILGLAYYWLRGWWKR
jgi:uncharacterized SAM-binding protein YcdF (DUF218 family)